MKDEELTIGGVVLRGDARIDQWEIKSGNVADFSNPDLTPDYAATETIDPVAIIDLTSKSGPDGNAYKVSDMIFCNRFKLHTHFVAAVAAVGLSFVAVPPTFAQVGIEISADELSAALGQCTSAESCGVALQKLIDSLVAANPDVDLALVIGSVISAVASGYHAGTISPAAAKVALASAGNIASSNNLTALAVVATNAVATVVAGDPIDIEAVAEASGSPT